MNPERFYLRICYFISTNQSLASILEDPTHGLDRGSHSCSQALIPSHSCSRALLLFARLRALPFLCSCRYSIPYAPQSPVKSKWRVVYSVKKYSRTLFPALNSDFSLRWAQHLSRCNDIMSLLMQLPSWNPRYAQNPGCKAKAL